MKNLLLLILLVFSTVLYGQSEPITSLQGQNGTKFTSPKLVVPHSQATKTPLGGLIETGNNNLLANPSFEHQIVGTGWTAVNGSCSSSSGVTVDGLKNCLFTSSGTNWSLSQCSTTNAPRLAGQEMENSVWLGSASTSDPIWVCPGTNGSYPTPSVANGCMQYTNIGNIQQVKNYFLGDSASTSNCIRISGSNSGTTVGIDKAYTGLRTTSEVSGELNTPWQSCGLTTADFQGFGTVSSIELQCKRSGPDLLMRGKLTLGTTTAVEARLNLKLNGVALTSDSSTSIPSLQKAGEFGFGSASASYGTTLVEPSVGYITFGIQSASNGGIAKANGSTVGASGVVISLNARVPIAGWQNNINAFSTKCDDPYACNPDVYTFTRDASGTLSNVTPAGWVTCGAIASGSSTCTINSALALSSAMDCKTSFSTAGAVQSSAGYIQLSGVTNSGFTVTSYNTSAVGSNFSVSLSCSKTLYDYARSRITQQIVQMRGVPTVTGSVSSSIGSSKYYGASLGTACSALPCQNLKPIGQMISSVGWTGSVYRVTLDKTYKKASCSINAVIFGTGYTATETYGENVSQLDFSTAYGTAPGVQSSGTVNCIGEY